MRKIIVIATTLIFLVVFNGAIIQKEHIKANGEVLYMPLAPSDPRSLMQGDYMRLRFRAAGDAMREAQEIDENRGHLVIERGDDGIGKFVRIHDGSALAKNEFLFRYVKESNWRMRMLPDSYLFQEGHEPLYRRAEYGVFRAADSRSLVLVGLADLSGDLIEIPEAG